uniref:Uncharacterized protein n=1 Tax=Cucumis melo TaxID=3656 RepID=A0A9I9EGN3_CUCME
MATGISGDSCFHNKMRLKNETAFAILLYFFGFVPVPPMVIQNDDWTWEDLCHYLYKEKAFDNIAIVLSPELGSPACANDISKMIEAISG